MNQRIFPVVRTIALYPEELEALETLGQRVAAARGEAWQPSQGHNSHRSELVRLAIRKLSEHPEWVDTFAERRE